VAAISLGYKIVDGKRRRVRKKFVGATRSIVHKRLTEALHEHQTGGIVPLQHESFGDVSTQRRSHRTPTRAAECTGGIPLAPELRRA